MAFNAPNKTPNFDNPYRPLENKLWNSAKADSLGDGSRRVGTSLNSIFHGSPSMTLPLYKDKPYQKATARERRKKQRIVWCLLVFLLGCTIYWIGVKSRGYDDTVDSRPIKFANPESLPSITRWDERRNMVKDVFIQSWHAYERSGWGQDEFYPVSEKGHQMVPGGLGWIIVDSLDTLMIMELKTELKKATDWLSTTLSYDTNHPVNTFETTIRMLGGLLSAHYLSLDYGTAPPAGSTGNADVVRTEDIYLEMATSLAHRLIGAYNSTSGVPYASINLHTGKGIKSHADDGASSTAEAGTLQLEMKYLAKLTGEHDFWTRAEKVIQVIDDNQAQDGLVPIFIYADQGEFKGNNVRLGSRGDSYYEYLIKQYLQTSSAEPIYLEMWKEALAGIRKHLLTYSSPSNFVVLSERPRGLDYPLDPKMDHLACFLPGTIALSVTGGKTVKQMKSAGLWTFQDEEDMLLATELMKTCWGTYKYPAAGLAPEITYFNIYSPPRMVVNGTLDPALLSPKDPFVNDPGKDASWRKDFNIKPLDRHNLQRPEAVESLFYLYRITEDEMYQRWGWEMFQSFVKQTGVEKHGIAGAGGYTSLSDVTVNPALKRDNMESFWLSETLKYFYLLFSPSTLLPLDEVVFNTEAHPFPRFELGRSFKTGWERKEKVAVGKVGIGKVAA